MTRRVIEEITFDTPRGTSCITACIFEGGVMPPVGLRLELSPEKDVNVGLSLHQGNDQAISHVVEISTCTHREQLTHYNIHAHRTESTTADQRTIRKEELLKLTPS